MAPDGPLDGRPPVQPGENLWLMYAASVTNPATGALDLAPDAQSAQPGHDGFLALSTYRAPALAKMNLHTNAEVIHDAIAKQLAE